jgi:hypothetical protein
MKNTNYFNVNELNSQIVSKSSQFRKFPYNLTPSNFKDALLWGDGKSNEGNPEAKRRINVKEQIW